MKEIINISCIQLEQSIMRDNLKMIADFLDVKCEIKYVGMTPGFFTNTCRFKLFCEGQEDDIAKFKKELNRC